MQATCPHPWLPYHSHGNHAGPIFLEGVDCRDDCRGFIFVGNPIFLVLGVHPTWFDDVQADHVDDNMIVHWVACHTCVGCTNQEARCEGLKTVGGMPVSSHPLLILFAIFGRCFAVFWDTNQSKKQPNTLWKILKEHVG